MIKANFYLAPDGALKQGISQQEIDAALRSGVGLLWLDLEAPTPEDGRLLLDTFHFHPLNVEDCVTPSLTPPKVDEFDDYLFIVVHGVKHDPGAEVVETTELDVFLGKNYVVSNHALPSPAADQVLARCKNGARPLRRGPDFLAHELIDALVDNILPTINELNERSLEIEDAVLKNPTNEILGDIMNLKRSTVHLQRIMAPQRDVASRLSREDHVVISERSQLYFRDIYDHMVRIHNLTEGLQELADSTLRTYMSAVSNRMNDVMRMLSLVATVFLPLTLIASIYGMNFVNFPELGWRYGYAFALGVMLLVALGLLGYFKYRKWM
ncbi:MAG: magnesium/cobalt transporter CorA [Chloroflexota bacterium]|nr:magnesium/cobalt transporter CorA [Chloroflexota bacterium]